MKDAFTARPRRAGFTLVELLAVIAIVAVLAALLVAGLVNARNAAQCSRCLANLRSTYMAAQLYSTDHKGVIVPGSTQGATDTAAELWPVKLDIYFRQLSNGASATFACPKWTSDNVSASAYNWGYAMNLTPGYAGAASTSVQKQVSVITYAADGSYTGAFFRMSGITNPAQRLFFCDSNQWQVRAQQVVPANPGQTLASYSRHGKNHCNVVFFDGHTATLTPVQVDTAIYSPGAPLGQ